MTDDKQTFILINPAIKNNAAYHLGTLAPNGDYEVVFRKISAKKTLKQLGALFGSWTKYISSRSGESEERVHRRLKAKFLARIYIIDPKTSEQEMWVDLLAIYQISQEQNKRLEHARRISLGWATLKQMKEYMNVIEQHYQDEEDPLPIIDKNWKGQE